MSRSNPLRIASRPGLFLSLTRLDWFALYLATASVLLFALSMLMSSPQGGSVLTELQQLSWLHAGSRQIALNRVLLMFLGVELLLLQFSPQFEEMERFAAQVIRHPAASFRPPATGETVARAVS